jgi:hypothetical protein
MTPKDIIRALKNQGQPLQDFLKAESFEKRLAKGLQRKIVMEVVTDSDVNDLNRILGFVAGRDDITVCLAEIRKYSDSGKVYLEVNVRYPDESSPVNTERLSLDDFAVELGKKYRAEAMEIKDAIGKLSTDWKVWNGTDGIIIWKPTQNGNMAYGVNLNGKYEWITLWAKPEDYARISVSFKGEDIRENQPGAKKHFVMVRFPFKGMTSAKLLDILEKLDTH